MSPRKENRILEYVSYAVRIRKDIMENGIKNRLKDIMNSAQSVVVLTGAGISAESGVPTFRGEDGLWKNYRAEDLATPYAFERDPALVWEWYNWRRELIASLKPNKGHYAIAKMEEKFNEFSLLTQNIDGLHQRAGSRKMSELHGSIWKVRCAAEGTISELKDAKLNEIPPYCRCGALLRPHVVWFGESLEKDVIESALKTIKSCELFFSVGTSTVVQPAASFAMMAKERGAYLVEVNIAPTPLSDYADVSLMGKAGEILPQMIELL